MCSNDSAPNLSIGTLNNILPINNSQIISNINSGYFSEINSMSETLKEFIIISNSWTSGNSNVNSISFNNESNLNDGNDINELSQNEFNYSENIPNISDENSNIKNYDKLSDNKMNSEEDTKEKKEDKTDEKEGELKINGEDMKDNGDNKERIRLFEKEKELLIKEKNSRKKNKT